MAEYKTQTIKELIDDVNAGRVVLPSIQRNFVWPEQKIYHLFDSLMRDYPIGTFLFWEIDDSIFNNYVFNTFIRDYDEQKGELQRGERATTHFSDYKAVLDGQQRITSLYIGACGKYRIHIKRRRWDDPSAFIDKYLCIDIMYMPQDEDKYHFEFKELDDIERIIFDGNNCVHYWCRVSTVLNGFGDDKDEADYIDDVVMNNPNCFSDSKRVEARKMLKRLSNALTVLPNVNYYPAKEKNLTEVVDIFVRVNSGGEKLNSSDLMLSVASGEQADIDIHKQLQESINDINDSADDPETGFKVDKELILTAGLMLTGAESLSLSKNSNYTHERMNAIFKDNWDRIVDALKKTVKCVEYIGFIGKKLSKSIVLPIAYYFYYNDLSDNHMVSSSNRACCDRIFIRQWLLRAMLNDVFMEGTGATLLAIRNVIERTDKSHFPLEDLMQREIKKPLRIENDLIDDILEIKYGDSKIAPIFDELLHVSPRVNNQVDHIWPKSILTSKRAIRVILPTATEEQINRFKDNCNLIVNLQLLDRLENQQKQDTEYDKWLETTYDNESKMTRYCEDHFIPQGLSYELRHVEVFWDRRRELLRANIIAAFPSDFNKIVERYNLQNKI